MATTYVSIDNLTRYDGNIKTYVDSDKTKSINGYLKKNNIRMTQIISVTMLSVPSQFLMYIIECNDDDSW